VSYDFGDVITGRVGLALEKTSAQFDNFYVGAGAPEKTPVADFSATTTSGDASLTVEFADLTKNNPTSWNWDFGDGDKSTAQNPSHTYESAGNYTVSLTAGNKSGADDEVKTDYITVTERYEGAMHVHSVVVSRQSLGAADHAVAKITIHDQDGGPVPGATVYADYSGPDSGSRSGTTDDNGQVTFTGSLTSSDSGEWCFEVTDVTKSGWAHDPDANEVTQTCESGSEFDVNASEGVKPKGFGLFQNTPNPFNSATEIRFALPVASHVTLEVFNVRGARVSVVENKWYEAGIHSVNWNASGLASGVYYCRLRAGEFVETRRMILLK
jgi:PKD repeat protein